MIWFTSDTHFGHVNIIRYCNRPFESTNEMNEEIIRRWNQVIADKDIVYHLGDFCYGNPKDYFQHLRGRIILLPGSHDRNCKKYVYPNSIVSFPYITTDLKEIKIILCHYAMRSWEQSHYGSWHLFGHHHGRLPPHGLSFDVGVDTNDFYPYSIDDIEKKMRQLKPIVDYSSQEDRREQQWTHK